jgi:hypothetical protein
MHARTRKTTRKMVSEGTEAGPSGAVFMGEGGRAGFMVVKSRGKGGERQINRSQKFSKVYELA